MRIPHATAACLLALSVLFTLGKALAAEPDFDTIADKIVRQSLEVRPGEVIIVNGNPSEIALMAALQVAVAKAGGEPILQLNIPEADKRAIMETPMEHLKRLPTGQLMMLRAADGVINVASVQDPKLFADVPEERLAAQRQAAAPLNDAFLNAAVRIVTLGQTGGIPTAAYAAHQGVDYDSLRNMFWQAVAVDPRELAAAGSYVTARFTPGATVHVTSQAGTNLTFRLANAPARINAGRTTDVTGPGQANAWLPAGEAYATIAAGSANGKLVVPQVDFRGKSVTDLTIIYENGRMTSLTASGNEKALKEFFASSSPETAEPSVIDIGLNTASQPIEGSLHRSWEMGGLVNLGLGNNSWAGGGNDADGAFTLHLHQADLEVGNQALVSSGQLSREIRAAYRP